MIDDWSDIWLPRIFAALFACIVLIMVMAIIAMIGNFAREIYCFKNPTDLACKTKTDSEIRIK